MVEGKASPGTPLRLVGRLVDTRGQPPPGARLYLWPADGTGRTTRTRTKATASRSAAGNLRPWRS